MNVTRIVCFVMFIFIHLYKAYFLVNLASLIILVNLAIAESDDSGAGPRSEILEMSLENNHLLSL